MVLHIAKVCFYIIAPYSQSAKFFQVSPLYKQILKMTLFGIETSQIAELHKMNLKLSGHYKYH